MRGFLGGVWPQATPAAWSRLSVAEMMQRVLYKQRRRVERVCMVLPATSVAIYTKAVDTLARWVTGCAGIYICVCVCHMRLHTKVWNHANHIPIVLSICHQSCNTERVECQCRLAKKTRQDKTNGIALLSGVPFSKCLILYMFDFIVTSYVSPSWCRYHKTLYWTFWS